MSISLNVTNQDLYLVLIFVFTIQNKFDIDVYVCIIFSHFYDYLTVLLKSTACNKEYDIFDAL
jgi:hypothetical protein